MAGLSWLGVDTMSRPDADLMSQAQPDPNRLMPAAASFSLNASKLPNVPLMAEARLPTGVPPLPGPIICQNMEWFQCPPPLLRTAVRIFSGTIAQLFASSSSMLFEASAGADSRALFRFVT